MLASLWFSVFVPGQRQYDDKSQQLRNEIKRRLGKKVPWRHDVIIHHVGLEGLIKVGVEAIKPQFDAIVNWIATQFGAEAIIPNVKGPERSKVKVAVRYGGDATQLSDIVRATLKFKMHAGVQ